ncbi:Fur-regulated basic protein FbpA [Bacillus sp. JJ1609]|uniref:Fur-regulated basic protein FbpA n=1 Tax=Bacillus sp. JJ1609 TaxID=3122977 RepID=UPI002FFD6324
MSMHLRSAIERLKDHYIHYLMKSGFTDATEDELKKFTITELKNLTDNFAK